MSQRFNSLDLQLPTNGQPTEVLAFRFASWRKIIRSLNIYFKDFASVQDEVYKQNLRLTQSVNFPFFQYGTASEASAAATAMEVAQTVDAHAPLAYHTSNMHPEDEQTARHFLPFGSNSISDIPSNLLVFHSTQAEAAHRTSRELMQNIIPRLEDLRRDLLVKIKEIKNLNSDFKNAVSKEQELFHRELANYNSSIQFLLSNSGQINPKNDPYILKQSVGRQLTRQVNEENYLLEAYLNIQTSGKELERVVAQEVQSALSIFGKLVGAEAANIQDLLAGKILNGYASSDPVLEWDSFIQRDANFVDPDLSLRNIQDLSYPNMHSSLAYEIRSGYLERRSKYLKSYSRAWYVLTPTFLHEFKSSDRRRDPYPVMSLSLSECSVEIDSKSSSSHKFILNTKSSRAHKWVFRAESQERLNEWFNDLKTLSQIETPVARAKKYFPSQEPFESLTQFNENQQKKKELEARAKSVETDSKNDLLVVPPIVKRSSSRNSKRSSRISDDNIGPLDASPGASRATSPRPGSRHSAQQRSSHRAAPQQESGGAVVAAAAISPHSKRASSPPPAHGEELTPVLSDTSEVTSTGEPFGAGVTSESFKSDIENDEDIDKRKVDRGRFPSEVKLDQFPKPEAAPPMPLHPASAGAKIPNGGLASGHATSNHPYRDSAVDDNEDISSVFSYDLKKGTHSTLPYDTDFQPVGADIPVNVERRLTQTHHKDEAAAALTSGPGVARNPTNPDEFNEPPEQALLKRRDSINPSGGQGADTNKPSRKLSRRATGSFGVDDGLKPLTSVKPESEGGLFFSDGLPQTTSGSRA